MSLGRGWLIRALFTLEDYEELTRALTRFNVEKSWSGGLYAFGETTLLAQKPEIDVTLGVGYRKSKLDAVLSLTALDFFNDMIYEGLVVDPGFADTAVAYATFPWALRGKLHWDPGSRLRFEGDAAYVISSRFSAFRQASPDTGFVQSEDFAFVGLLGEYSFSPRLRAGAFLHYAFAETDRAPLSNGDPTMDYVLTERTTRAGGYVLLDLGGRWRTETWLAREARPERRSDRSGSAGDVDYEDRSWMGTVILEYRPPGGFRAHAAFEMDLRDVLKGDGEVPVRGGTLGHNTRLRFDLGWRFGDQFQALAGYRIDLDGDPIYPDRGLFDGAHARFVLYW